ncbi:DUF1206 domain-containing protein [Streptomyces rectiviolaceus]|uniref:DUF1206 domain-containing protein n=1 Tax=Streptomyces rectiviolaceus TaxID=332591 RepID=A0ABP6NI24_9ACTN
MTPSRVHARGRTKKAAVRRRSAEKESLTAAGRAGFVARGVVYVLIGALALQIALGSGGEQADREGALAQVAEQPFGEVMLWALVVGFGCMALWRGSRALLKRGPRRKAASRALDGGRALFYAFVCWATAAYASGGGQGSSGDAKSKDWTKSALELPYGRLLVGAAGCVLIGVGGVLAVRAMMRRFLRQLDLGSLKGRTRQTVTALGVTGGVARGTVFAAAGIFVVAAAVQFDSDEAKGVDATLRSFAHTPAGPWLLAAVAAGLILFGVFSFASARWRRL